MGPRIGYFHALGFPIRCMVIALDLPPKGETGTAAAAFEFYNSLHEDRPFSRKRAHEGVVNRLNRGKKNIIFTVDGQTHTMPYYMQTAIDVLMISPNCDDLKVPGWFFQAHNSHRLVPGTPQNGYIEAIQYAIWAARVKTKISHVLINKVLKSSIE
jgi:hypothetical protein